MTPAVSTPPVAPWVLTDPTLDGIVNLESRTGFILATVWMGDNEAVAGVGSLTQVARELAAARVMLAALRQAELTLSLQYDVHFQIHGTAPDWHPTLAGVRDAIRLAETGSYVRVVS